MTKSSKTLLLVLGGVAVLGGGGAVIYFATRKPEKVEGNGSTPKMPPPDDTPKGPTTAIDVTPEQLAQIANVAATLNLATALKFANSPPKPNWGEVGGSL